MSTDEQLRSAATLLKSSRSDEDIAHLTGVPLPEILGLRAEAASGPGRWPSAAGRLDAERTQRLAHRRHLAHRHDDLPHGAPD